MDTAVAAGCSIHFEAGLHTTTSRLGYQLVGTPADPVVISGDGAATTKLLRPNASQNMFDLSGEHFVVRDLTLEGGAAGIRLEATTSNATFTDLIVHGTDAPAFMANTPGTSYTSLSIRNSEFYDTGGTGECLYLGCNNNGCTMGDSIVEFNYCHDTNDPFGGQGEGIDLKGGSFNVIVRHNVIENVAGKGIIAYANDDDPQNIIEANVVWNSGDVGIQATGDAVIRNNVVILETTDGVDAMAGSPSNQGLPNNLQFINNTVVKLTNLAGGRCLTARGWSGSTLNMTVANNALYCPGGEALYIPTGFEFGLVTSNAIEGSTGVPSGTYAGGQWQQQLEAIVNADAYPASGSLLLDAGSISEAPLEDFNCLLRDPSSTDVGAYQYNGAGNPGWTGIETFKSCASGAGGAGIGGGIWDDRDGDGIQGADEPAIGGVVVELLDNATNAVRNLSLSGGDGSYNFANLTSQAYRLRFTLPADWVFTMPDMGGDDALDSDAHVLTGETVAIGPAIAAEDASRWDAGLRRVGPCLAPDEAVYLYSVRLSTDGNDFAILDFQDPNQPTQVTGYNIYRSSDPALPAEQWVLLASNIVDMDQATLNWQWVDQSNDVPPGGLWYYEIAPYNAKCDAEGPR